jgi:hypothetical protein
MSHRKLCYLDDDNYAAANARASAVDVGELEQVFELRLVVLENGQTNEYLSYFDQHSSDEESSKYHLF